VNYKAGKKNLPSKRAV